MGFIENVRLKRQLKEASLKSELAQVRATESAFSRINEATTRFARPDVDDHLWTMHGTTGSGEWGTGNVSFDHYEMLNRAYDLYNTDLFARAIVRNLCKFVLGIGPTVEPKSKNTVLKGYWDDFKAINKWQLKEKEMVKRVFRDGEVVIRKFVDESNGSMKVRFLRANNIKNPIFGKVDSDLNVSYGIGTAQNDIEDVRTYYFCDNDGYLKETIPAEEIIHIKIFADSDVKRGMSLLLVTMPMIRKYMDWLEDRIVLNKVRSAIALIKKVEGTASTVQSIRDSQMVEHKDQDRHRQKALSPGTVITAGKGIEYQMLSPNINASDSKDDGRAMLLAVAAGIGFPEMLLTSDYSNANYSSTMVAQNPFVREIEDWQDFFGFYYKKIYRDVVRAGKQYGEIPDGESEDCILQWPTLILADIEKNNKAREIQFRNKILSRTTWQQKESLVPEEEKRNLEMEDSEDVYKGFALPAVPVNQYGADSEE